MKQYALATFGIWELLIILAIVLVIFGAGKLPQIGEAFGKAIRNFKRSFKEEAHEVPADAKRLEEGERTEPLPPGRSGTSAEEERAKSSVERG
ncbi:MAG TPA: twin-arginine translocase TatA/TatE family subunit [Myxococcota bacterium]|nr:twin-arginine translocase TatA/TatE family subunit [Myxococcota bacterium]HRY91867.1 twin-arginine translocase TatA/TatE family subunit [Myxococcota bacterium]HSA23069.1 twin-arginine translocase TatA/TatE family subunit [Myxococcota bacterium]